jgi:hypothetical protein
MPPAFALSQDQTLRFIQASPCNQSHTATPKRTSKGSSLSPNTSQPPKITKHQAKTPKTDIPKEHPPRRRPRIPPRHSSQQGKNTQQLSPAPNHPKIAKHYQLPKKPDAIVKQQKKNQQQNASQRPNSPASSTTPIIGRAKILANPHQPVKPKSPTTSR